jgi:serine/threonine protein kinase
LKRLVPTLEREMVTLFLDEARLLKYLDHPNIAATYDSGRVFGTYFIAMEYVRGPTLKALVEHCARTVGAVPQAITLNLAAQLCDALDHAHTQRDEHGNPLGIIHRDVTPANIILSETGLVKLIDFGLAMAWDRETDTTDPGVVKGKMSYLSPEIVSGGRPIPHSDQFAVGSVLWEALVGRKLFDGHNDYETYVRLRECQVQPLRPLRPDVPADFAALLHRALSPQPAQRFPSAREFARQIGTTLKKVQLRKDLHTVLAKTVNDARGAMGLGFRTGDLSALTPVAELRPEEPPAIGERLRGLRHKLPGLFGRKKA